MRTILKGGVVVNLDGGPSEKQDLVIEGDRIASVGASNGQAADNVVDVSGMYLLPGLVNCHVHLGWDGTHDLEIQAYESPAVNAMKFKVGAQWIKIMGSHEEVQFTMDELRAMVEEAHQNGMKVTAHATFDEAISRVVDAGVDCVEHGGSMTSATIEKMVDKGIPIVTTFSPLVQQVKFGLDFGMTVSDVERRKDQMNEANRFAGNVAAAKAGIPIVFGTDAGSPVVPHYAIAEELKFMVEIGVCPDNLDALNSITRRGIKLLGLEDQLGSLEAGKTADVVAVGSDPLVSLDAMKDVRRVFVRGQKAFSSEGGYLQVGRDIEGMGTRWGPGPEVGYRRA